MKNFQVTRYFVSSGKISPESGGFTFAVISDLHSNCYGIDLHRLNREIIAAEPDAVLLTGDIFNRNYKEQPTDTLNYLVTLSKHFPVFYGIGNHEYDMKMYPEEYGYKYHTIKEYLQEAGIVFLEDETVFLEKNNNRLALTGVMIDSVFYKRNAPVMGGGLMDRHLGISDKGIFNILLAHNPDYFQNYSEWGADLVLSGHLHGGTIRIPGKGGLLSPRFRLFPEYDGGLYKYKNSTMIVSRGMGSHTVKLRINNEPELIILKVLAKNDL